MNQEPAEEKVKPEITPTDPVDPVSPQPESKPQQSPTSTETKQPKKINKKIIILILVVVLLFIFTAVSFFLKQQLSKKQTSIPSQTKRLEEVITPQSTPSSQSSKPKSSDLSSLWLYLYSPDANALVEYNNQKTGIDENGTEYNEIPGAQYFEEGAIADPDGAFRFGGEESGAKVFFHSKPDSGKYLISFHGPIQEEVEMNVSVFNKEYKVKSFNKEVNIKPGFTISYFLTLDNENTENFASFEEVE